MGWGVGGWDDQDLTWASPWIILVIFCPCQYKLKKTSVLWRKSRYCPFGLQSWDCQSRIVLFCTCCGSGAGKKLPVSHNCTTRLLSYDWNRASIRYIIPDEGLSLYFWYKQNATNRNGSSLGVLWEGGAKKQFKIISDLAHCHSIWNHCICLAALAFHISWFFSLDLTGFFELIV